MRLRTPLLLLAGALAGAIIPSTAFAAVPTTKPKFTVACPDKPAEVARVWWRWNKPATPYESGITQFAADNPCGQWLAIPYGGRYASSAAYNVLDVAPHAHFNWGKKELGSLHLGLSSTTEGLFIGTETPGCAAPTTVHLVYRYNDVRTPTDC